MSNRDQNTEITKDIDDIINYFIILFENCRFASGDIDQNWRMPKWRNENIVGISWIELNLHDGAGKCESPFTLSCYNIPNRDSIICRSAYKLTTVSAPTTIKNESLIRSTSKT